MTWFVMNSTIEKSTTYDRLGNAFSNTLSSIFFFLVPLCKTNALADMNILIYLS